MNKFYIFFKGIPLTDLSRDTHFQDGFTQQIKKCFKKRPGLRLLNICLLGTGKNLFFDADGITPFKLIGGDDFIGCVLTVKSYSLDAIADALATFQHFISNESYYIEIREDVASKS